MQDAEVAVSPCALEIIHSPVNRFCTDDVEKQETPLKDLHFFVSNVFRQIIHIIVVHSGLLSERDSEHSAAALNLCRCSVAGLV